MGEGLQGGLTMNWGKYLWFNEDTVDYGEWVDTNNKIWVGWHKVDSRLSLIPNILLTLFGYLIILGIIILYFGGFAWLITHR